MSPIHYDRRAASLPRLRPHPSYEPASFRHMRRKQRASALLALGLVVAALLLGAGAAYLGLRIGHAATVEACRVSVHAYPRCDYILAHQ